MPSTDSLAERLAQGMAHKEAGNALYQQRDYTGALRSYYYAVLHLSGLDTSAVPGLGPAPSPRKPAAQALREDQRQLSQMAACFLAMERFDRAIEVCDQALASDATNAKAIFRKTQALRRRGDLYAARDWLARPAHATLLPSADFQAEQARIDALIRERERSSAARWRGFLS